MRVVKVTKTNCKTNARTYAQTKMKCSGCNKTVKLGERVLLQQGTFVCHLEPCLVEMVAREPEFHDYESEIERITKELIENGI